MKEKHSKLIPFYNKYKCYYNNAHIQEFKNVQNRLNRLNFVLNLIN